MQEKIVAILQAIAVGDAMGMPTEFMTREEIVTQFGFVDMLIPTEKSKNHSNLKNASITDDTEQNFYLMEAYSKEKSQGITISNTAQCLLRWAKETDAEGKKYIGPSSMKALHAIEQGVDPKEAGKNGTTCGGIMRTPSAVLCSRAKDEKNLATDIINCCIPTHFTQTALEAACGYGFALQAALEQKGMQGILDSCFVGANYGKQSAPYTMCFPSGTKRILALQEGIEKGMFATKDAFLDYIYNILGTGLESEDIFAATMGIFMYAKKDVWLGICMGASIGGDTDTIACLVGALCAAYAGKHNIPSHVVLAVEQSNPINIPALAKELV